MQILFAASVLFFISACESTTIDDPDPSINPEPDSFRTSLFPPFITPVEDYFVLNISFIPEISPAEYRLEIYGAETDSVRFSLDQLSELVQVEKTLTIECIDNPPNGNLIATASWKGFRLYDLLDSLGIRENTSIVKYSCADGYFTYNSIEELKLYDVIGALYMNDQPLPSKFGFPLRILFPGYYGVRQPGWVTKIELLDSGPEDFWSNLGWATDSAMAVDSKIFFPGSGQSFSPGDTVEIGGAAYGPRRISSVDISIDEGKSWIPSKIIREIDEDFVWVFWEVSIVLKSSGDKNIYARATSADGRIQPGSDLTSRDGSNAWPLVRISVIETK